MRVRGWLRDYNGPYMASELQRPAWLELIPERRRIHRVPASDTALPVLPDNNDVTPAAGPILIPVSPVVRHF